MAEGVPAFGTTPCPLTFPLFLHPLPSAFSFFPAGNLASTCCLVTGKSGVSSSKQTHAQDQLPDCQASGLVVPPSCPPPAPLRALQLAFGKLASPCFLLLVPASNTLLSLQGSDCCLFHSNAHPLQRLGV